MIQRKINSMIIYLNSNKEKIPFMIFEKIQNFLVQLSLGETYYSKELDFPLEYFEENTKKSSHTLNNTPLISKEKIENINSKDVDENNIKFFNLKNINDKLFKLNENDIENLKNTNEIEIITNLENYLINKNNQNEELLLLSLDNYIAQEDENEKINKLMQESLISDDEFFYIKTDEEVNEVEDLHDILGKVYENGVCDEIKLLSIISETLKNNETNLKKKNSNINKEFDEIKNLKEYIDKFEKKVKTAEFDFLREQGKFQSKNEPLYNWIEMAEIKSLKKEISSIGTPDKIAKVKKYLNKLAIEKPILEIKDFDKFNTLNIDCPNFKEVSKFYKGSFVLNNSKYLLDKKYGCPIPILLLGEPGIGKTYFAKKLAKIIGTNFNFLDANSITASWVLTGSSGQWQNSDAGNIFKYMLDCNTVSPIVIFDEIDKLSQGKNYDPFSVFHQILEQENSSTFKDEFLNVTFDASKIIYILTANNSDNIPESLISRMRVFNIERPNLAEMRIISQNIYSEIMGKSPLLKEKLSEEILDKLVSLAPRDIKKQLSYAVYSQLADNQNHCQDLILEVKNLSKGWGF